MSEKKSANYKNWVPKGMVYACAAITTFALLCSAAIVLFIGLKTAAAWAVFVLLLAVFVFFGAAFAWCFAAYNAFSYTGKRQLSRRIIEKIASYVALPAGGTGLDVGCGSGALTIACAKKNPGASMVGIDRWGKEYASFSKALCEANAEAEGAPNASFAKGDVPCLCKTYSKNAVVLPPDFRRYSFLLRGQRPCPAGLKRTENR